MEAKRIGSKIARARKEQMTSQAELSRLLFISPQAVGKWERGESMPDIIMLNRLAKILGVDLNYFSEDFSATGTGTTLQQGEEAREKGMPEPQASQAEERKLLKHFNGSNLVESDLSGVVAHRSTFNGSDLHGSDFSGADLTGSSFAGSDAQDATFDKTNLTDCRFHAVNLVDASFRKSILVRTGFNASDLTRAAFINVEFVDVKFTRMDLRKTIFEHVVFRGVDFKASDLTGVCFDGMVFTDVTFDNVGLQKATFKGAVFQNVSFRASLAITNRFYRNLKQASFAGATMDKLTYAALKGMGADLSEVKMQG